VKRGYSGAKKNWTYVVNNIEMFTVYFLGDNTLKIKPKEIKGGAKMLPFEFVELECYH